MIRSSILLFIFLATQMLLLHADGSFRVDIIGVSPDVILENHGATHGFTYGVPHWLTKDTLNKRWLWLVSPDTTQTKWEPFEFKFSVSRDTRVKVIMSWSKGKNDDMIFGAVKNICIENAKPEKWEYEGTELNAKEESSQLHKFITFENRAFQNIHVREGQTITISGEYRMANKEEVKQPQKPQPQTFTSHNWELMINQNDGYWMQLKHKGKVLAENKTSSAPMVIFDMDNTPVYYNVEKIHFDENSGTLVIIYSGNGWKLSETIEFSPQYIVRKAKLLNCSSQSRLINGLDFQFTLGKEGRFLLPGTFFYDNSDIWGNFCTTNQNELQRSGSFDQLPENKALSSSPYVNIILLRNGNEGSQVVFPIQVTENITSRLIAMPSGVVMQAHYGVKGWFVPEKEQELGTMVISAANTSDLEQVLAQDVPELFSSLGFSVPDNRPSWAEKAAIFSAEMNRFQLTSFKTFKENMTKRLSKLGFNTVWFLPIFEGTVSYSPTDYYKRAMKFGTWDDCRDMIDELKKNHLRPIVDIVPHGGEVKTSLTNYLFGSTGYILNSRPMDFNNPDWNNYMSDVADFYTRLGFSGFRVDAIAGSPMPNWRRADFPNIKPAVIPFNDRFSPKPTTRTINDLFWDEFLSAHKTMPPLPYDRASMSTIAGGVQMAKTLRLATQNIDTENITLLEAQGFPFTTLGDIVYDVLSTHIVDKLRGLPSDEFVRRLRVWLNDQKFSDTPDALLMRYVSSHDNPTGNRWLGVEPTRAVMGLTWLVRGVPLMFDGADVGNGHFIRKINRLRNTIPDITSNHSDYNSVISTSSSVFTFQRSSIVGVINFSPQIQDFELFVPDSLKAANLCYDIYNGEKLSIIGENKLHMALPAWGIAILGTAELFEQLKKEKPSFKLRSTDYKLLLNSENNLIDEFCNSAGKKLIERSDLLSEIPFDGKRIECKQLKNVVQITIPKGTTLVLPIPEADSYQINTAEGILDDWFNFRDHKTIYIPGKSKLAKNDNLVYCSRILPLQLSDPHLRIFTKDGQGLLLRSSLEKPADIDLLNRPTGAELRISAPNDYAASVEISCEQEMLTHFVNSPLEWGNVKLSNDGIAWRVENDNFIARISRTGGGILSLFDKKSGEFVLENQEICASAKSGIAPNMSAYFDFETITRIFPQKDETIKLVFQTELRNNKTRPELPVQIITEYKFSSSAFFHQISKYRTIAGVFKNPQIQWKAKKISKNNLHIIPVVNYDQLAAHEDGLGYTWGSQELLLPLAWHKMGVTISLTKDYSEPSLSSEDIVPIIINPDFSSITMRLSLRDQKPVSYPQNFLPNDTIFHTQYRTFFEHNALNMYFPDPFIKMSFIPHILKPGKYHLDVKYRSVNVHGEPKSRRAPVLENAQSLPASLSLSLEYWNKNGDIKQIEKSIALEGDASQHLTVEVTIDQECFSPMAVVRGKLDRSGYYIIEEIRLTQEE